MIISYCTCNFYISYLLCYCWAVDPWFPGRARLVGERGCHDCWTISVTQRRPGYAFYSFSHICTTFEEMRRKTDAEGRLQGSTREPVRILSCHFFEKWNGRSVHCHRALQKTDCWESETDWNELWAHKFTLRAWKPIVTTSLTIHEDD